MRRFLKYHSLVALALLAFWHVATFSSEFAHLPKPLLVWVLPVSFLLYCACFFWAAWRSFQPFYSSRVSLVLVALLSCVLSSWLFWPASMFITSHLSPVTWLFYSYLHSRA